MYGKITAFILHPWKNAEQRNSTFIKAFNNVQKQKLHFLRFNNKSLPGGSMKSKWTKSSIPSFFSCKTTDPRFDLKISGYVLSCISCL